MKVTEAVKTLIRRLNTCFQLVKKRFPVVAYENIAIRVAKPLVCSVSRCQRPLTRARAV